MHLPRLVASLAVAAVASGAIHAAEAAVAGANGYSVRVFAPSLAGTSGADSVEVIGGNVYVGYSNGTPKDGSGGTSTIAEYSAGGTLLNSTTVAGHTDGLRYNAATNQIWSMQNEDANANLVLITPNTLAKSAVFTAASVNGGGGFDDAVFTGGRAYLSASNPATDPNNNPAIVSATLAAGLVNVASVLAGNAPATPLNPSAPSTLNLQDPDSLSLTADGRVVLTSQADGQLIFVSNIGTGTQSASVLKLQGGVMVDDTSFASTTNATLVVADKTTNVLYAINGPFGFNTGYSDAQDANANGFVGALNADGTYTQIVTGLGNPGGSAFLVPEPASLALVGTGLLALIGLRRRSK